MEASSGSIIYPTAEEIIALNRSLIEDSGSGWRDTAHIKEPGTLDWALYNIEYEYYEPCPTLVEKATVLAWKIIAGHVFWDGNKRTGMGVALTFLITNGEGYVVSDGEIEDVAVLVADWKVTGYTREDLLEWFKKITNVDWDAFIELTDPS
jgi:death-on-curing protein